jgi:Histidine kinase
LLGSSNDVVTHNMSVMVVQAQAAQTLAGSDTDRAREAMRAVEDAGRTALMEMRRLLGVIRADEPVGTPGIGLRSRGWRTCPAWCCVSARPACPCRM